MEDLCSNERRKACRHEKRQRHAKAGILLIAVLIACSISNGCAGAESEMDHYVRYADYLPQQAVPAGLSPGANPDVLVAWFSRVGNTVFEPGTDAVSSATLNRDSAGGLVGNAQMIAGWIAEESGADLYPIRTAYTYPSDYQQTVAVGEGQDIDFVDLELAGYLDSVSGYDVVFLVAPVWHYTVCTPLRAFLEETDFSGKTIYVFTTHCGSRFADSVEKIQAMQPDADVIQGVAVSGYHPEAGEQEVRAYVRSVMQKRMKQK